MIKIIKGSNLYLNNYHIQFYFYNLKKAKMKRKEMK